MCFLFIRKLFKERFEEKEIVWTRGSHDPRKTNPPYISIHWEIVPFRVIKDVLLIHSDVYYGGLTVSISYVISVYKTKQNSLTYIIGNLTYMYIGYRFFRVRVLFDICLDISLFLFL